MGNIENKLNFDHVRSQKFLPLKYHSSEATPGCAPPKRGDYE